MVMMTKLAEALYLKSADSGWYNDGGVITRTIAFPRAATEDLAEIIATVLFLYDARMHGMLALEQGSHTLSACGMVLTLRIKHTVTPELALVAGGAAA